MMEEKKKRDGFKQKEVKRSMPKFLVTTIDNPYNPFTRFEEWLAFDTGKGYNTCEYLARIAATSHELSETDEEEAINRAVDDIVRLNINGLYKKVSENEPATTGEDEETESATK